MSDNFQKQKETLVQNINDLFQSVKSILDKDKDKLVFSSKHKEELINLISQIKSIKDKIEKDKIEIAVIGQEDSGKSSLLNALIKTDIFPTDSGRTTYTETKLVAGIENKVEVKIYSKKEFNNYVQTKLIKPLNISVENFDIEASEVIETIKVKLQEKDKSVIAEELKLIIEYRSSIIEELKLNQGKTLEFNVFNNVNNSEYKEYIAGKILDKEEEIKTDITKPSVAKEIIIYSTEINELEHAVIYDVPGFNSPTQLHKDQTKNMLKKSDAIIFVSDVTSPNLKDDELNILKDEEDEYGITVKDKLFVFGNKLDRANNERERNQNVGKFKTDYIKNLFNGNKQYQERIFIGSAGLYLVKHNISDIEIQQPDFEVKDSIDLLRHK